MPITRAFHGLPSSGREPHITTPLRENAAVQCGKIAHRIAEMGLGCVNPHSPDDGLISQRSHRFRYRRQHLIPWIVRGGDGAPDG
jgi:hypothetical protein